MIIKKNNTVKKSDKMLKNTLECSKCLNCPFDINNNLIENKFFYKKPKF